MTKCTLKTYELKITRKSFSNEKSRHVLWFEQGHEREKDDGGGAVDEGQEKAEE